MKRISSRWTYFHKRVFPVIWFGILALVSTVGWTTGKTTHATDVAVIMPIIMALFGYLLMRYLVFDLVDEAWDSGDYLVFKNKGLEETVRLDNIKNVSSSTFINPPRVTLTLRTPNRLGKQITFSPPTPFTLNPFWKSPIVNELIQRVDRARNR